MSGESRQKSDAFFLDGIYEIWYRNQDGNAPTKETMMQPRSALFSLLFVSAALLQMPSLAFAQTLALDVRNPDAVGATFDGTYGYAFIVTSPTHITALGVYDSNSDGLTRSHPVGFWDSPQASPPPPA